MAQIIRPVNGPLKVTLPFRPHGGNFELLKVICGERTRPQWIDNGKYFEVAREHLAKLLDLLPNELGASVEVTLVGATQTKCVSACWDADPKKRWDCVCSCAGRNHGSRRPLPTLVSADLSIETEYTSEKYTVHPRK